MLKEQIKADHTHRSSSLTTMDAREEILARLRDKERPVESPAAWSSRRRFDDLAERFLQALTAAKGEVYRVASLEEAATHLDTLLTQLQARRVVANNEPPLTTLNLPARWPGIEWYIAGFSPGDDELSASHDRPPVTGRMTADWRAFCATADVGLSGAAAALAETGSIIVSSGPGRSRLATLLPPIHIALVAESCLTADLFTWIAARHTSGERQFPASLNLISGPSKTADIEQTMAIGVHGPRRLIAVLYGE